MGLSQEGFPADIRGVRAVGLDTFVTWVGRGVEWSNVGVGSPVGGGSPPSNWDAVGRLFTVDYSNSTPLLVYRLLFPRLVPHGWPG